MAPLSNKDNPGRLAEEAEKNLEARQTTRSTCRTLAQGPADVQALWAGQSPPYWGQRGNPGNSSACSPCATSSCSKERRRNLLILLLQPPIIGFILLLIITQRAEYTLRRIR